VYLLELYGKKMDYDTTIIHVNDGGGHLYCEHYLQSSSPVFPSSLTVLDPFNPTFNVGHRAFLIKKVRDILATAHTQPRQIVQQLYRAISKEQTDH